ncbi:MAG: PqqD family protein [Desulfuromonadales bacterium]
MAPINRRQFGKTLICTGLATASITLAANAVALDQNFSKDNSFICTSDHLYPVKRNDLQFVQHQETAKIFKHDQNEGDSDYIETNGMGYLVAQLCRGSMPTKSIVNLVSDLYNIDEINAENSVNSFLKFLFDEGYISFASKNFISKQEAKVGRGFNLLGKNSNTNIKVTSINGQNVQLTF